MRSPFSCSTRPHDQFAIFHLTSQQYVSLLV